jgi:hypothetical protein
MPNNFRKLPPSIKKRLDRIDGQYVVAGCSRSFSSEEISSGKLKHLGINLTENGLIFPTSIIPPSTGGKYSDWNVNGHEVIRKDLPKETRYHTVQSPNWGDSSNGTHPVDLPHEAYPRDSYAPSLSEIKISSTSTESGQAHYTLVFELDRVIDRKGKAFEDDLLEAINVLQENLGTCGVQKAGAKIEDYLKSLTVSWEVLPPGTKEEAVARVFSRRTPTPEEKALVEDRYTFLMSLKPESLVYGLSGIQRYFGGLLHESFVIFENIEYGNAIYVMFDDWKELSKRSRTELLSGRYGDNFERVTHVAGWKASLRSIVRRNRKK